MASLAGSGGAGGQSESTQGRKVGATVLALAELAHQRSLLALTDVLQLLQKTFTQVWVVQGSRSALCVSQAVVWQANVLCIAVQDGTFFLCHSPPKEVCLFAHHVLGVQDSGEHIAALREAYRQLQEVDPLRRGYYADQLASLPC